eukprot:10118091-Alexandrium_andersonii.AAC.1
MSASLVGSEMCIRDRRSLARSRRTIASPKPMAHWRRPCARWRISPTSICLLYTSDAADDM